MVCDTVGQVLPVELLRHIAFSHFVADEWGSINEFLAAASGAMPLRGRLTALASGFWTAIRRRRFDKTTPTGGALRAETMPQEADGCDAAGERLPFAATKTARLVAGNPRLSLEERYKDHATYVSLVTSAVRHLQQERLLLAEDVQDYITAAKDAAVLVAVR